MQRAREKLEVLYRCYFAAFCECNEKKRDLRHESTALLHLRVAFCLVRASSPCIRSLEFVFILELRAAMPLLMRDAFVRYGNSQANVALVTPWLSLARVFLPVAPTKDRFNYSVPEPDAYRGDSRGRHCDVNAATTSWQSSDIRSCSGRLHVNVEFDVTSSAARIIRRDIFLTLRTSFLDTTTLGALEECKICLLLHLNVNVKLLRPYIYDISIRNGFQYDVTWNIYFDKLTACKTYAIYLERIIYQCVHNVLSPVSQTSRVSLIKKWDSDVFTVTFAKPARYRALSPLLRSFGEHFECRLRSFSKL